VGDVGNAEGPTRRREEFHHRLASRRVALVNAAKVNFHELVQLFMGRASVWVGAGN
jgi:hypothetical protein